MEPHLGSLGSCCDPVLPQSCHPPRLQRGGENGHTSWSNPWRAHLGRSTLLPEPEALVTARCSHGIVLRARAMVLLWEQGGEMRGGECLLQALGPREQRMGKGLS